LEWPFPARIEFVGQTVRLEPLAVHHVHELWHAAQDAELSWKYHRYGPFETEALLSECVRSLGARNGQPFWAVRPTATKQAQGWLSLCDVYPVDGAIEIGSIWYSPSLQRTRASTEAVFLLMKYVFDDLGYQRLAWRCPTDNFASLNSARRFGFKFEGIWRDAALVKGYRIDFAWHSMLAHEWPDRRTVISAWLSDANFTELDEL
jgi:RimJ/RimL family protein N-acetyltransferase